MTLLQICRNLWFNCNMDIKKATFAQVLKSGGYSLTAPRLAIFDYLIGKKPIPVSEIIRSLSTTVDKASIYRTLHIFQELGIAQRHNIGWKYKIELSDMFTDHHHHLACNKCGSITPISEQALEKFIETLARQHNFTPMDHQVEIQGYCSTCNIAS